jgi:hypothetical protein
MTYSNDPLSCVWTHSTVSSVPSSGFVIAKAGRGEKQTVEDSPSLALSTTNAPEAWLWTSKAYGLDGQPRKAWLVVRSSWLGVMAMK